MSELDREGFYEDDGCPCGGIGCDECDDPCEREELDFARGICRECETWGEIQCRVHGDAYIEGLRFHDEITWLVVLARRGKRTKAGRRARLRLHAMRVS